MRNMIKNKDKVCAITVLTVLINTLVFLQSDRTECSCQISILERSVIYMVVAVSMNPLTGFTGLFSLGQTGFMAAGTYAVAIFTIPAGSRVSIYYVSGVFPVIVNVQLPAPVAPPLGGLIAAGLTVLIGIPALHLKSDYLTIATLGFSEIIRALITVLMLDIITNGSYNLKDTPRLPNIFAVFGLAALCIGLVMLLINSSYDRASKSIHKNEIVAQPVGASLFRCKEFSPVISPSFTGVGGGMLAMFMRSIDPKTSQVALTYDILPIVALGGIGSTTGSMLRSFVVTAGREALYLSDDPLTTAGTHIPLFRSGFRMIIFSILPMAVALFYSRSIMGNREFPWEGLFRPTRGIPHKLKGKKKEASASRKGGAQ